MSFNLILGIFMLCFIGFSSGAGIEDCPVATGTEMDGCVRQKTSKGFEYAYNVHDELIIWKRIGPQISIMMMNTFLFLFCTSVEECKDNGLDDFYGLKRLTYIRFNHLRAGLSRSWHDYVFRYNVAIMEPRIKVDYIYPIDVSTFNFPAAWYYFNDERYLKVILQLGKIQPYGIWRNGTSLVFFRDEQDRCESYRPKAIKHENILNLNFFVNRKYSKYSYFFIKKDNFICSYVFKPEDLDVMFNETENGAPNNGDLPEIQPINFILIDNFPTQNYAQNFFCLDPLYGTFVSFFWNHEPSSPPEAHYYSVDESNLQNFEMIDKIILKDFDMNVLKDIFENRFDKRYLPIFESYGRQVFIRFVYPKEDPEDNDHRTIFSGLWKNENEKDVKKFEAKVIWSPSQRLNAYDMNVVFRAKKSWIQKFRPYVPKTTTKPPTTVPTTTSPTVATTVPTTTMPRVPPGTAPPKQTSSLESTSIIDSSTASLTSTTTTSSKNSGATNDTNSSQILPTPAASRSKDSSKDSCSSFEENLWWILILIIIIDIIEVIILVILIICKFRGAKKMKEAMAKKNVEKFGKKNKKKPQSSEAKEIMPKKKPPKMKKQKKSSVKKSKDTGKKTATTTTTFDQTNYFTVNDTFEKNTK